MSKVDDFVFVVITLQRYHFHYSKNVPKVIGLWISEVDVTEIVNQIQVSFARWARVCRNLESYIRSSARSAFTTIPMPKFIILTVKLS